MLDTVRVPRSIPAETGRRSVVGSTFLVMAASALSAVLGFGREMVTAHFYGTHSEMDAFLNASTIPTIIFGVFNVALVSALVPMFSEYMSLNRGEEVRRLGSTVINMLFFALSGLAALGWFLAPIFVPVVAHGFPPAEQSLVVQMVRWLLPGIVATSIGGVCAAMLNANHRFLASALVWVAANLVTIGCVIFLHGKLGIFALALGSVLGLFAQLFLLAPSVLRLGLYRFELDIRHPGLLKTWALIVPVAIGSGASQINLAFDRYFASTLSPGSTAGLGYTTKLTYLPILIVAGAIATVTFPLIAAKFATSDRAGIRRSVSLALRMVSFIVIPCAAGLSVLAYPIVQTLFERGAFGESATIFCASLVPFACLPLITSSYITVLWRACNACRGVRFAVVGAICTVAINIVLSGAWLPTLGARGLLLANGIAGILLTAYLIAVLYRLVGALAWKTIALSLLRISIASLVMASAINWIHSIGFDGALRPAVRVWYLIGLLASAAITYLSVARLLGVEEVTIAVSSLARKLANRDPVPQRPTGPIV